jgi:hypothetical protein
MTGPRAGPRLGQTEQAREWLAKVVREIDEPPAERDNDPNRGRWNGCGSFYASTPSSGGTRLRSDAAAVAGVLDHLEDHREELTAVMSERFHLVPERQAEAVPVWGS